MAYEPESRLARDVSAHGGREDDLRAIDAMVEDLRTTRGKVADHKRRIASLEEKLRDDRARIEADAQRHARSLADDLAAALSRQADAERRADEAVKRASDARAKAAAFYRKAIAGLYRVLGLDEGQCSSCHGRIWWVVTKNGRPAPYTVDGVSHFADCPTAKQHRKGGM